MAAVSRVDAGSDRRRDVEHAAAAGKIGGKFEIARNAGGGTLVTMRLPVEWS